MRPERVDELDQLREDWDRLAEPTGHPFASWEWNSLWWEAFGAGRELYCFACRDEGGAARAILPLYLARSRPLGVARFLGYADLASPLCKADDRPLAAAAMKDVCSAPHPARLLFAERLPGSEGWGELLGGRVLARAYDPALRLSGMGWEEWLASRSRNFRQQVRRRERRLVEEHGLGFRLSTDPARLDADLDALYRLHAMRWGEESSGVFAGDRGAFQRRFAAAAQRRGWLRLWLAEIDGEIVAAWYGWRFAGQEWYYQAGRDPRYDELSLGFVLLSHTIRAACEDGVEAYRFLAGMETYKQRFINDDLGTETVALGRGPVGRLAVAAAAAGARAPAGLRQVLQRRSLGGVTGERPPAD